VPWTILLEEDVAVDPRKYGPLVAPALGLTVLEARLAVRRGRGIFLERLAEADARRIVEELARDGIRARAVPEERLPSLPPPRKAVALERGDEILTFTAAAGEGPEAIPWEAVAVASIGVIARRDAAAFPGNPSFAGLPALHKLAPAEREILRENLILKLSPPAAAPAAPTEKLFETLDERHGRDVRVCADLVTEDLGTWLRVSMEEIAYAARPGGVRLGGAWGFELLVQDLRRRRPEALTGIALKLLGGADIKELVFPRIEEFTRHTAWCALTRTLWPTGATSSPSPEPPESSTDAGSSNASSGPAPGSTSS
jgi:hypothetical protein